MAGDFGIGRDFLDRGYEHSAVSHSSYPVIG
jgi:hypothetical protein